jgi:hypothetical protein
MSIACFLTTLTLLAALISALPIDISPANTTISFQRRSRRQQVGHNLLR